MKIVRAHRLVEGESPQSPRLTAPVANLYHRSGQAIHGYLEKVLGVARLGAGRGTVACLLLYPGYP